MRIRSVRIIVSAAALGLLFACAGGKSGSSPQSNTITGVAAAGAPISGIVSLKDSSAPAREINTATSADGKFSLDLNGLKAPFMLKVDWTTETGSRQLYSLAVGPGTANINPLSNAAVAAAARVPDPGSVYASADPTTFSTIAKDLPGAVSILMTQLAPALQIYGAAHDPITDAFTANHTGMDAFFDNVTVALVSGQILVTNKLTGTTIFSAPIVDVSSGIFNAGNMPTMPGGIDGAALYTSDCSGCHGPLATSAKLGASATQIQTAINSNTGGMGKFSTLTSSQIQAIATALTVTSPAPMPTPAPSPTIDGAALYTSDCSGCHGPLATSAKLGATVTQIQTAINNNTGGMGKFSTLTSSQIQAIATALASTSSTPAPLPTDGSTLYTNYCSSCHGPLATSSVRGATASQIKSEIQGTSAMNSLSFLTSTQIQYIASALAK